MVLHVEELGEGRAISRQICTYPKGKFHFQNFVGRKLAAFFISKFPITREVQTEARWLLASYLPDSALPSCVLIELQLGIWLSSKGPLFPGSQVAECEHMIRGSPAEVGVCHFIASALSCIGFPSCEQESGDT